MVLRARHREGAFARLRCIQVTTFRLATAGVPGTREELSQLSLIRDYYLRFRVLIHEIGKFGIVGVVATIITFAMQNALYGHVGPTTSVVVANAIATCFAFLGNRYWAFRHRKTANMGRETVLFVFFNLVGTVIQTAFVDFNHYALGNHDRISLQHRDGHRHGVRDALPAVLLPQVRLQLHTADQDGRGTGHGDAALGAACQQLSRRRWWWRSRVRAAC